MFEHLRQPIAIGGLEVPNRIMMTVHGTRLSPRRFHRYLEERVRGGVGLDEELAYYERYFEWASAGRPQPVAERAWT